MRSVVYGPILVLCYSAEILDGRVRPGGDAAEAQFFSPDGLPEIAFDIHRRFLERHAGAKVTGS
jgi:hypothetical protein